MIMKDKTVKRIRWCCYVALALCALWGILYFSNIIRSLLGYDEWPIQRVNWSEHRAYKIGLLAVYSVSIAAMIAICVKVAINILKGLREYTVFPKNNVKLLFWFVAADFLYLLAFNNLRVLWDGQTVFMLQHNNFVTPFFLLFFAFMYKIAADAVEENNLTV